MSRLPSYFDLAGQFGSTQAPSPSAGFGGGQNITNQLLSQELNRQGQLGTRERAFGDSASRMQDQERRFDEGIQFARGFDTAEDVTKQFDILQRSTEANLAGRGFLTSNLGAAERARVGEQKETALGEINLRQQVEAADKATEDAYQRQIADLQKQLLGLGAPPSAAPVPAPTPPPVAAPTGPRHGASRKIGMSYGQPIYEYYNAQTGEWQRDRVSSRL